jgi:hypothetical protein
MDEEELPLLQTFGFEVEVHRRLFEQDALWIAQIFLECFDEEGNQRLQVPKHVLEALAQRFRKLMRKEVNTLDAAFGGKLARQRNRILSSKEEYTVSWDHMTARSKAAQVPHFQRHETPFEAADEEVAAKHGTSPENIRRIYKKAGKRR